MASRPLSMRGRLVVLHRLAGLTLALFLLVTGLTGSLLVWHADLDEALNPSWFRVSPPEHDVQALDPLVLREHVQARYPDALITRVPLAAAPGRATVLLLRPLPGKGPLENDQLFIDPYTGHTLGQRRWGAIRQGLHNLIPFVYQLHHSLALGSPGTLLLGLISLLWMIDCVVGLILTLPLRGKIRAEPWLSRWGRSWKVDMKNRWRATFDLHRAGGLWLWPILFVLAWSSFALNLPQVHDPLADAFGPRQPGLAGYSRPFQAQPQPLLDWTAARARARQLMADEAARQGFEVQEESSLSFDPARGLYRYDVRSTRDIKDRGGSTRLFLDAHSGEPVSTWLPTGASGADTLTTWLSNLHMATLGGLPYRLLMTLAGLGVAVLSVTGVLIWQRKRRARQAR